MYVDLGQTGGCERYQVRLSAMSNASMTASGGGVAQEVARISLKQGRYCPQKAFLEPKLPQKYDLSGESDAFLDHLGSKKGCFDPIWAL